MDCYYREWRCGHWYRCRASYQTQLLPESNELAVNDNQLKKPEVMYFTNTREGAVLADVVVSIDRMSETV